MSTRYFCQHFGISLEYGLVVEKVIKQIQALLRNYLWSGREHRARARVAWDTCTKKQRVSSLSLIDPHDALDGLMSK